jgi:hypothetical protein
MIAPLTGLKKEKLTTRGIGCNHRSSAENIGRKKSDEHAGAQAEDDDTPTSSMTCKKTDQLSVVSYAKCGAAASLKG